MRFIFDVDGVVLDSIEAYRRAWGAWATEFGVDDDAIWAIAHGRRPRDIVRSVAGAPDDETAALRRFETLIRIEYENVRAHDGAHGVLSSLPGWSWAVATSGDKALVRTAFRRLRLPTPHRGVYGGDVEFGKPHPGCFLLAAEHLTASPTECVVVEDSPNGVAAGKAAGMTVIAVTTTHAARELREADDVYDSLADAATGIRALAGR